MAEWITASAAVVGLVSIYILWRQLFVFNQQLAALNTQVSDARRQLQDDHERSRRQLAVKLMRFWCIHANYNTPFFVCGRRLVQEFSKAQCKKLQNGEVIVVDGEFRHLLDAFRADFPHQFSDSSRSNTDAIKTLQGNELELSKTEVACLRMILTRYLNCLETVATAWRHNVADRGIIEEEFERIISFDKKEFVLEAYRRETGVYPSINELAHRLISNQEIKPSKPPLGS